MGIIRKGRPVLLLYLAREPVIGQNLFNTFRGRRDIPGRQKHCGARDNGEDDNDSKAGQAFHQCWVPIIPKKLLLVTNATTNAGGSLPGFSLAPSIVSLLSPLAPVEKDVISSNRGNNLAVYPLRKPLSMSPRGGQDIKKQQ